MSTIRFIADLHIFDMYSMDWRDISLDDYASVIEKKWNTTVSQSDVTVVVGDIGHQCDKTIQFYQKLNGTKILVIGNHDLEWGKALWTCGIFQGIHREISMQGIDVIHIPDESSIKTHYYIHGHHHNYKSFNMRAQLTAYAKDVMRLNCAADLIGNVPRTLQELVLQKELFLDSTNNA